MTALTKFSLLFVLLTTPALAITLSCSPPANPTVGQSFNMPCAALGGTAPYFFQITGNFPPGLTFLNVLGGEADIQGTPTVAGSYSFTIIATDIANNSTSAPYTIVIAAGSGAITLASVSPSTLTAGTTTTLYFYGTNFTPQTLVHFNGLTLSPTYQSSTSLYVSIPGSYVTTGTLPVYLTDVTYGTSGTLYVTVGSSGSSGIITLTQVSPSTLTPNTQTQIILIGTNFTASTVVIFNGNALVPQLVSSTELIATIQAAYVTSGTLPVYVYDPTNGTSGTLYVTVGGGSSGGLSISSISPTSAAVNSGPVTLTIYGSGFSAGALLTFGTACTLITNFVSSSQLTATIPNSCLSTAQTVNVSVGGSNTVSFTIGSGSITLSSLSPTAAASGTSFTLYIYGSNFTPGTTVHFNGYTSAVIYESSNAAYVTIPGAYVTSGSLPVYLTDPTYGTSNTLYVTVSGGTITLTQVSPNTLTPLTGASLILTGTNFTTNSIVYFNGTGVQTQYVNSTELTATVPAAQVTSGNLPIYVFDPTNGTSGTLYVTVTVSLTSISPTSVPVNSGAFTLTVNGAGFTAGALLSFGSNCTVNTTYSSSTQLFATIPASCLTVSQTVNVTVAGSNALPFIIGGGIPSITCSTSGGLITVLLSYSQTCSVTGGTAPFTWTVSNLPAGIYPSAYNEASSFTISGAPLTAQSYAYTVHVADSTTPTNLTANLTVSGTIAGITSISPQTLPVGSSSTTLNVFGGGFALASTVYFNSTLLTTTFISSTQLSAQIPANLLTTAQYASVYVMTAGNDSNLLNLVVSSGSTSLTMTCNPGVGPQTVDTSFSATCVAAGGTQPYTWTAPGLPNYLFLSGATGSVIYFTGWPSYGSYNYTVKVTDSTSPAQTAALQIAGQTIPALNGVITSLSPNSAGLNSGTVTLTVTGTGFSAASQVFFSGSSLTTTYLSPTQLTALIPSGFLTFPQAAQVTVRTSSGISNAFPFIVGSGGPNPVSISCSSGVGPVAANSSFSSTCGVNGGTGPFFWTISAGAVPPGLTLIPGGVTAKITGYTYAAGPYSYTLQATDSSSPPSSSTVVFAGETATASSGTISLTYFDTNVVSSVTEGLVLLGQNFTPNSVVYFNGTAITSSYINSSEILATIPGPLLTSGTFPIYVTDPANGTSGTSYVTVTPSLGNISPTTIATGSSAFTLTLFGAGFAPGAVVSFGSSCNVAATFYSSTELSATIPASCLTTAQAVNVSVSGSNAAQFVVAGPITLSSLSPSTLSAGTTATLYFYGTNFTPNTVAHFNGATILTNYISSTVAYAVIPGSYVTPGSLPVYLTDSTTGTSNTLYVTATIPLILTSLSPATVPVGSPSFTLTLNGSGFTSGLLLNFGSVCTITTTFVNSTQLTATIPAPCLTTVQTLNVSVGTSNSLAFVIASTITLNQVSPTSIPPGYQATLDLCGTNFTPNSIVHVNNTPVATFFLDSGSLVATVPYPLVNVGTLAVYVTDPSTGTSGTLYVTVPVESPVTVTLVAPATLTAGHAVTLNLTGTGFTASAIVFFNGSYIAPTYMGAMQLSVQVPASAVTAGTLPVDVYDPYTVYTSNVVFVTVTP